MLCIAVLGGRVAAGRRPLDASRSHRHRSGGRHDAATHASQEAEETEAASLPRRSWNGHAGTSSAAIPSARSRACASSSARRRSRSGRGRWAATWSIRRATATARSTSTRSAAEPLPSTQQRESRCGRARQRSEGVHARDRRTATDRLLARRVGDCARPLERAAALAAADEREGRVVAGRDRQHRVLRRHGRPRLRRQRQLGRRPLGLRHGRPHQLEPVDLGQPPLHHDVRGLDLLPRPPRTDEALEPVLQPRLLPLRELLRQPLDRRPADLHRRALGDGLCARCARTGTGSGRVASARSATRRRRSPAGGCSSAASTARSARTAPPRGRELWRRYVPGRILGAAVVVGNLVFFSTLETNTYAARVTDGRIVWKIGLGKYSPGIATERHYYFSLNGMLVAFRGRNSPPEPALTSRR